MTAGLPKVQKTPLGVPQRRLCFEEEGNRWIQKVKQKAGGYYYF